MLSRPCGSRASSRRPPHSRMTPAGAGLGAGGDGARLSALDGGSRQPCSPPPTGRSTPCRAAGAAARASFRRAMVRKRPSACRSRDARTGLPRAPGLPPSLAPLIRVPPWFRLPIALPRARVSSRFPRARHPTPAFRPSRPDSRRTCDVSSGRPAEIAYQKRKARGRLFGVRGPHPARPQ